VTADLCRAARELLGWPEWKLAHRAGCCMRTLRAFEDQTHRVRPATLARLRAALDEAGVEFIAENGGGAGVRLAAASHHITEGAHARISSVGSNPPVNEDAT
jgi:hypothetical protein